jgi:hypothetical protein
MGSTMKKLYPDGFEKGKTLINHGASRILPTGGFHGISHASNSKLWFYHRVFRGKRLEETQNFLIWMCIKMGNPKSMAIFMGKHDDAMNHGSWSMYIT